MSRVSVIIPAYNAAAFVNAAVDSVLAQSYADVEVVVVNDGSTDDTGSCLARYGDRIRVITQRNRGLPAARNVGAAHASGEWLAFLDADDEWLPEKLACQLAMAADDVSMVYTDRFNIGARGDLPVVQSTLQPMYEGDVFLDLLETGNVITVSSVIIRRRLFESLKGFCETLVSAEDWDLWVRVAERHSIHACRQPLVRYRFHEHMMSGDPQRMWRGRCAVVERALALPRGRSLAPWVKRRILWRTWLVNGWDARRAGYRRKALEAYLRSLWFCPIELVTYRELVKTAIGRA